MNKEQAYKNTLKNREIICKSSLENMYKRIRLASNDGYFDCKLIERNEYWLNYFVRKQLLEDGYKIIQVDGFDSVSWL